MQQFNNHDWLYYALGGRSEIQTETNAGASVTPEADKYSLLAVNGISGASVTIANPTWPADRVRDGQELAVRISKSGGGVKNIFWGADFRETSLTALPGSIVGTQSVYALFKYNEFLLSWDLLYADSTV